MISSVLMRVLYGSLLLYPATLMAAGPIINDPLRPYDPLPIDAEIEKQQIFLGELTGDPHLYEVTLTEEKFFTMKLLQLDSPTTSPFSFILVRDNGNNRGVSEVGRVFGPDVVWQGYRDGTFAIPFKAGMEYSNTLQPGVYRFEVSTPDNKGSYLMFLGSDPGDRSYFEELGYISDVQRFFGYPAPYILLSSYVLYPLGSVLLIGFGIIVWRQTSRKRSPELTPHV